MFVSVVCKRVCTFVRVCVCACKCVIVCATVCLCVEACDCVWKCVCVCAFAPRDDEDDIELESSMCFPGELFNFPQQWFCVMQILVVLFGSSFKADEKRKSKQNVFIVPLHASEEEAKKGLNKK